MSQTKIQYPIAIPNDYVWMSKANKDRGQLFRHYVRGYLKRYHPELTLVNIQGMIAICERR